MTGALSEKNTVMATCKWTSGDDEHAKQSYSKSHYLLYLSFACSSSATLLGLDASATQLGLDEQDTEKHSTRPMFTAYGSVGTARVLIQVLLRA